MNLTMIRLGSRFWDSFKKIAMVLGVLLLVHCSLWGAMLGHSATGWTADLIQAPISMMSDYHMGERFVSEDITYEYIPLPEGVDQATLKEKINLRNFNRIVHREITYLLYEDPFGTGEDVVFFLPLHELGQDKEPVAFYAKVVDGK